MIRSYLAALTICFASWMVGTTSSAEPEWIWGEETANESAADGSCLFRRTFDLQELPKTAVLQITCDNQYVIRLNGRLIGVDEDWQDIEQYNVTSVLKLGDNEIFVNARNLSQGPAGLLATLKLDFDGGKSQTIATNDTWEASVQKSGTWDPDAAKVKKWKPAFAFGDASKTAPWKDALALDDSVAEITASRRSRDTFELQDGDRVLFLGNTVIEREQRYGYWEAALTTRFPDKNIIFRNLGWSGDTVFGVARARFGSQSEGFGHLEVHVHAVKPTVIICGYGSNAVFAGEAGLGEFIRGYEILLDTLETTGAMIALMAPLKHEAVNSKFLSPKYNSNRELYRDAIRDLATRRNCHFFELAQDPSEPITDNGVHLTEFGYYRTASDFEQALGLPARALSYVRINVKAMTQSAKRARVTDLKITEQSTSFTVTPELLHLTPPIVSTASPTSVANASPLLLKIHGLSPGTYEVSIDAGPGQQCDEEHLEQGIGLYPPNVALLQAIKKKNELYFHRWRPQNETYLFLFRKHEQGNNAIEIPMFDALVADAEKEIARLRKPRPIKYVIKKRS